MADRLRQLAPRSRRTAAHPGPARATLPEGIREALVAHARAELPNEACGLIGGTAPAADGGRATTWYPTRNRAVSPFRYEIHPDDLLRVMLEIDDAGAVPWGIVHSHVRSPARPSPTDVGLAFYPDALYVIVSLAARAGAGDAAAGAGEGAGALGHAAGAGEGAGAAAGPGVGIGTDAGTAAESVRAWRIVDGAVFEVELSAVNEAI